MGIPSHTIPAHPPHPANLTILPALLSVAPLSVAPSPAPTAAAPIINPALSTNVNIGTTQSVPASLGRGRQRMLAQPMGQNWARNCDSALADAAASKSLKTRHQEINDTKKRTCKVLIWFEVGTRLRLLWFTTHLVLAEWQSAS
jgi:hypothetical protein